MNSFLQDVRYGIRVLAKRPAASAVIVAVLALGIGANSALFSVVNAVLLRPLPYPDASRLVMVWERNADRPDRNNVAGPANYLAWKDRSHSFEEMAAFFSFGIPVSGGGAPEQATLTYATPNLLPMLGASPMLGRGFDQSDAAPDSPTVVILSHGYWQRSFGGDPGVVGRTIKLNGNPATVVGVMPPDFRFYVKENNLAGAPADLYKPYQMDESAREPRGRFISVIGRLRDGVSVDAARTEMNGIAAELTERWPDFDTNWTVNLVPLPEQMVGDVRQPLWVLFGAVGFVLLIACANVANLALVRATSRRKEIAIRAAMGAGRTRIFRQLMTESFMLAAAGGVAGLGLGLWGVDLLLALSPKDLLGVEHVGLDWRVVAFTTTVAILTSVVFGLAPALEAARVNLNETMRGTGSRSATDARGRRVRDLFVVVQVALALVLLVGSGLLIKSLVRLQAVDPGFAPERVLTMQVKLPAATYKEDPKVVGFFGTALERVRAVPGVRSAGAISFLPFNGLGAATDFSIEGLPKPDPANKPSCEVRVVDPDYFATMHIPLVAGRTFTERENRETSGVVLITESFAREYFPGEDPLGKRVTIDMKDENTPSTIVGVVGDVRLESFDKDVRPTAYWPVAELPYSFMTLVIRTDVEPTSVVESVRRQIASIDPEVPISGIRTMEARLADSVARSRFNALLLAVLAGVALLIATVGLYGVVSYVVAQRTQEIGIRMALGATRGNVLGMVLRGGMGLTLAGIAIGVLAALGVTRLMSSLLFGVTATDPATFATIAVALAGTALLACLLPARRASAVDPIEALRHE